jgi:hypothetical protein
MPDDDDEATQPPLPRSPTLSVIHVEVPPRIYLSLPISKSFQSAAEAGARQQSDMYTKALKAGYLALIDTIYHEESRDNATFGLTLIQWRESLWSLFASVPFQALRSALDGTLHRDYITGGNVVRETFEPSSEWSMRAKIPNAPGIYLRPFVDQKGRSPTPSEFSVVVQALRRYAAGKDLDIASKIDTVLRSGQTTEIDVLKRGGHFYFEGLQARVEILLTWCEAITLLCDGKRYDRPLPRAITYCGYASEMRRREIQYDNRTSTTWLVLLVEAAFQVIFPARHFHLPLYPIAYLASKQEGELAERAFTRCTFSDFKFGGLCVITPGRSGLASLRNASNKEQDLHWASLETWRRENTDIEKNSLRMLEGLRRGEHRPPGPSKAELEAKLAAAQKESEMLLERMKAMMLDGLFDDDPEAHATMMALWPKKE